MSCYFVGGLGFGDEGKGSFVSSMPDVWCSNPLVVRYNGGSQAAHNVIFNGDYHTFRQFGSATLSRCSTFLSKFVLVNPSTMLMEAEELSKLGWHYSLEQVIADPRSYLTTRDHVVLNKIQEHMRGTAIHGSTGMGIGVTRQLSLEHPDTMPTVGDILSSGFTDKLIAMREVIREKAWKLCLGNELDASLVHLLFQLNEPLTWIEERCKKWASVIGKIGTEPLVKAQNLIFEGAQGILLDETLGFAPHVTWTDITFNNAHSILTEWGVDMPIIKIGVIRTYHTRHGAGPFPSDMKEHGLSTFPEIHNNDEGQAGAFRVGRFDIPMLMKALKDIKGVDYIHVNHVDVTKKIGQAFIRYDKHLKAAIPWRQQLDVIEEISNTPICSIGLGPCNNDKHISWRKACQSS